MNKAAHSQESKVLDSEAGPPTVMGPLGFAPESRTFQALPSHCTFPRHSLLHHTNAQGTGRANDGANHRGQGHILQGEGLILTPRSLCQWPSLALPPTELLHHAATRCWPRCPSPGTPGDIGWCEKPLLRPRIPFALEVGC